MVEINGGTLAYRDLLGGKSARLDRTRATLRQVQADKLGEALINAGAAVYSDPKSGTNLEVNELNATASAIDASRISAITARGTTVKWRDATLPTGVEGAGLTATARDLGFDSSGPLSVTGGTVTWRDPASGGTLNASALDVAAKGLRGGRLDEVAFKSEAVAFAHPTNGTINAGGLTGTAKGARASGIEDLTFRSSSAGFAHPKGGKVTAGTVAGSAKTARTDSLDDVSFNSGTLAFDQPGGGSLTANNVAALIKTMTFAQLQGVSVESSVVGYSATAATRAAGAAAPVSLQQVSITTPVLAFGTPVDAAVAFMHNKERVAGTVKLPTPEALTAGGAIPANVALKASRGTIDFDGRIEPGATTVMKGRTRAVTTSVDALAAWLVFKVPDTLKGPVTISGDIDAQGSRVALSNGQIEHGANKMAGTFAFDGSGARPKISGKITADRLDADAYIGMRPVPPKPTLQQLRPQGTPRPQTIEPEASLGDVFKEQVRAMLNAPPTRAAARWSSPSSPPIN